MAKIRRHRGDRELDVNQRRMDESLSNLEDRLSSVYKEAADGVQRSLDNFLESYQSRAVEMEANLSPEEYSMWLSNNVLRTRQMQAQIESLSHDLANVDKIAIQMINGELPEVYASSYNFGIYRADMQRQLWGGYTNASFSIYNADALRIIETEDPDLIPWKPLEPDEDKDLAWNRKHIQNAITQGILQGDSIPQLSQRLLPIVNMDENASRRTARTAYTSIQNQARRDATQAVRDAGIPMDEPWMSVLQQNTRDTHLMLHGTLPNEDGLYGEGIILSGNLLRFPADPLGDPEQIYNCQCRVQSFIHGIDHSHDDELYARFMEENYYDDWQTVQHYREDETREALERKRQLESGERVNRENAYRERLAERQAQDRAPSFTSSMSTNDFTIEDKKWSNSERYNLDNAVSFMSSNFGDITDLTGDHIYRRGSGVIGNAAGMYTRDGLAGRREGRCIYFSTNGYASEGEIIHEMTHAVTMEISTHYRELGYGHEDEVYSAIRSEVYSRLGIAEPVWDGRSYRQRPEEWLSYNMQNFEILSNKDIAESSEYLMSDNMIVMTRDVIQEWFRLIGRS